MITLIKKCVFWGGVFLIWSGAIVGAIWSKGYQPQTSRRLTDDDMIRISVNRTIQMMTSVYPKYFFPNQDISEYEHIEIDTIVPYRDVDHFLKENPDCCKISQGYKKKWVDVSGKVFYKDKSGQIHTFVPVSTLNRQFFLDGLYYMP